MGQYSKRLNEKTEEELIEIFNSISQHNGEFIDDFLAELDVRRMLWDMKVLLKKKDLFTLATKLESFSNSRYLDLLKREIEVRGLKENYEQKKNGFKKEDTDISPQNNKSIWSQIGSIGAIILSIIFLVKKFIPTDYDNKVQQEYYPIKQIPDQSYETHYPIFTDTPFSRKKPLSFSLDSENKPRSSNFVHDYRKIDSSALKILLDHTKSNKTNFDENEKPTFLDLKNQNKINKRSLMESNPFSKTIRLKYDSVSKSIRLKYDEKKLNKTK